jgi:hypothetical protein
MEAGQGSQAFFRGTTFNVTQGAGRLQGPRSLEGVFDVRAESQLREYLVRLHAFGKTSQPRCCLSSEPSLPEGDIISLLTHGGDLARPRQREHHHHGAGIAAEALYQASGLDRQVQKFLPRNSVIRDLSFHVSTLYNDANGLVEPTVQLESKFSPISLGSASPSRLREGHAGPRRVPVRRSRLRPDPVGQRVQRRSDRKPGGRSQAPLERRVALRLALSSTAAPARRRVRRCRQARWWSSVKLQMRGGGQVPADLQGLVAVAPASPVRRAVRRSIERLFSTGRFSDVVAARTRGRTACWSPSSSPRWCASLAST